MSKRNLIASAVAGVISLSSSTLVSADPLRDLQREASKNHATSIKGQERIDEIYEQTQDLLNDYRLVVDETENLKRYNDHVAKLVADQQREIDDLQRQIDSIDGVKKGVVPLMYNMIDSLEKFVALDVPIRLESRQARIANLKDVMGLSGVTTSEQFRLILEAYKIELDYGTKIDSYRSELEYGGQTITADFFNLGRTALIALSLDQKSGWVWDNNARAWNEMEAEYISSAVKAYKMANKLEPANLVKLPIQAAE